MKMELALFITRTKNSITSSENSVRQKFRRGNFLEAIIRGREISGGKITVFNLGNCFIYILPIYTDLHVFRKL